MDPVAKMIDDCFLGSWTLNELLWMNAEQWQLHRRNTKKISTFNTFSSIQNFHSVNRAHSGGGCASESRNIISYFEEYSLSGVWLQHGAGRGRGRDGGGDTVARGDPRILYITSTGWFDNILTFQSSTQNLVCFLLRNWKNYNTMRWETK